MKRAIILMLAGIYVLGCVGLALALGDGNHRKGKYLFRKHCRSCHAENATGAKQGKILEPATFKQAEWTEIFTPENAAAYECKDEWAKLSETDINDIYTYLHKFGADSPTPAKCK